MTKPKNKKELRRILGSFVTEDKRTKKILAELQSGKFILYYTTEEAYIYQTLLGYFSLPRTHNKLHQ